MAGAITVEELQILITANYGEAIRDLLKMVDEVKRIAETKLSPIQKTMREMISPAAQPMQQAVKATETVATRTAAAVKKTATNAKQSIDDLIADHDYLNEKIRISQKQYDLMREKLSGLKVDGDTEQSLRLEKQLLEAQRKIEAMTAESDRMAEALRKAENAADGIADAFEKVNPAVKRTAAAVKSAKKEIKSSEKQVDKFGRTAKKSTKSAENGFKKLGKTVKVTVSKMLIFKAISIVINAIIEGIENMANASEDANKTLSSYLSSFTYLKNSLGAAIMPILETFEPIITVIVDLLAEAINYVGMFIAAVSGQTTYKKAIKTQEKYADSLDETAEAAEKVKYALAGFDQVNILDYGDDADAIEELADSFEEVEIPEWIKFLSNFIGIAKNPNNNNNNAKDNDIDPDDFTACADAIELADKKLNKFAEDLLGLKLPEWLTVPIPAPEFETATAPAIDTETLFSPSLSRYLHSVAAPTFVKAIAPAIDLLSLFIPSLNKYQETISAPEILPVKIPALDTSEFLPSLNALHSKVKIYFSTTLSSWKSWGKDLSAAISDIFESVSESVKNGWESLKGWGETTKEKVSDWWGDNKEAVAKGALDATTIAAAVGLIAVAVAAGVPGMIAGAIGGIGTALVGLLGSLGSSGALVPAYASGGVITSPTLGLIGEYAGAKSNPEIVTPQNIMYDTVVEANAPLVSALYDMMREIIAVIGDKDTVVEMDGDKVGAIVMKYIDRYNRRTGK